MDTAFVCQFEMRTDENRSTVLLGGLVLVCLEEQWLMNLVMIDWRKWLAVAVINKHFIGVSELECSPSFRLSHNRLTSELLGGLDHFTYLSNSYPREKCEWRWHNLLCMPFSPTASRVCKSVDDIKARDEIIEKRRRKINSGVGKIYIFVLLSASCLLSTFSINLTKPVLVNLS